MMAFSKAGVLGVKGIAAVDVVEDGGFGFRKKDLERVWVFG